MTVLISFLSQTEALKILFYNLTPVDIPVQLPTPLNLWRMGEASEPLESELGSDFARVGRELSNS